MGAKGEFYTAQEIKERLSISTLVFWKYRPIGERTLGELARHGISRIELLESPEQFDLSDPGSMSHVAELCRACGIRVAAFHAHMTKFDGLDTEEKRCAMVDRCRRQLDVLMEWGGEVWGSHSRVMDRTLHKSYEELARHVEGTGVAIALENFARPECSVEKRVSFLDTIDHPQVGMILDIGHVRDEAGTNPMTAAGGPSKVMATCARRLCWVHLHGFRDGSDHHPPLCDGDTIQWVELFRRLHDVGYRGSFSFEPVGEPRHSTAIEATSRVPGRIVELEARDTRPPAW